MKTHRLIGFLTAFLVMMSVAACAPTYYGNRYGNTYARRHHHWGYNRPVPPRPYGGYGHPGW